MTSTEPDQGGTPMPDEPRPDDELPEDTVDPEQDGDDTVNKPDDDD